MMMMHPDSSAAGGCPTAHGWARAAADKAQPQDPRALHCATMLQAVFLHSDDAANEARMREAAMAECHRAVVEAVRLKTLTRELAFLTGLHAYETLRSEELCKRAQLAVGAVHTLALLGQANALLSLRAINAEAVASLAHKAALLHRRELQAMASPTGQLINSFGAATVSVQDTVAFMVMLLERVAQDARVPMHVMPIIHAVSKFACQTVPAAPGQESARSLVVAAMRSASAAARQQLVQYVGNACDLDAKLVPPALPLLLCMAQDDDIAKTLWEVVPRLCGIVAGVAHAACGMCPTEVYFACQLAEVLLRRFGGVVSEQLHACSSAMQAAVEFARCEDMCENLAQLLHDCADAATASALEPSSTSLLIAA